MAYALENALYQWRDGDRRLAKTPEPARADLDRAAAIVVEELRKRLGSTFLLEELADLYDARHRLGTGPGRPARGRHRRGRAWWTPPSPATRASRRTSPAACRARATRAPSGPAA